MNNKKRRIKQFLVIITLVAFSFTTTRYMLTESIPADSDITPFQSTDESLIIETESANSTHAETEQSASLSCLFSSECVTAFISPPKEAKKQKTKEVKNRNVPDFKKDMHQCYLEFDEQSVQEVKHIIEQINYNVSLTKTTHSITKYLTLSITSPHLPEGFSDTLINRIKVLLEKYEYSFGLYLLKKSEINLVILPSQESYLELISNLSIDSPNSQGVFWARSNYAFVAFKNQKQALQTALHEIVHALNFSLIGSQPRWLNEGLAELFESMEVTVSENDSQISHFAMQKNTNEIHLLDYLGLINAEQQWGTDERAHLYLSAHRFLMYLLDHQEGITIVRNLLQEESQAPCSRLSEDRYIQIIEDNIFNLPLSFEDWIKAER